MANLLIAKDVLFLFMLTILEKTYCTSNLVLERDRYFLNKINSSDVTNSILVQNSAGALLVNKFLKMNNPKINMKENPNSRNLMEPLGLRDSIYKNLLTVTNSGMNYLSFIEKNNDVAQESVFLFNTKPFTWLNVTTLGSTPKPRKDYSFILADSFLVLFGGCNQDDEFYNDLYFYDIIGQTWLRINQNGKIPSPRCGHTARIYGSKMWIFGGYSREGYLNDLYSLNLETVKI